MHFHVFTDKIWRLKFPRPNLLLHQCPYSKEKTNGPESAIKIGKTVLDIFIFGSKKYFPPKKYQSKNFKIIPPFFGSNWLINKNQWTLDKTSDKDKKLTRELVSVIRNEKCEFYFIFVYTLIVRHLGVLGNSLNWNVKTTSTELMSIVFM